MDLEPFGIARNRGLTPRGRLMRKCDWELLFLCERSRVWPNAVRAWALLTAPSWDISPHDQVSKGRFQWDFFIYLQAGNEIFPTDKNGKLLMSKSTFLDACEVGSNLFQECLGLKSCVRPPWGSALVWNALYITSGLFFSLSSLKWCIWRSLWRSEDGRRLIPSTRQLPGIKWDCQAWHKGPLPNETFPWSHETHFGANNTSL